MPVLPFYIEAALVIVFSLLMGSFSSALSYRVERSEPWTFYKGGRPVRSSCPSCHHVLGFWDLVPLFSWLFLKGRCRYCQAPISARYPLIEITNVVFALGFYLSWGFSIELFILAFLTPFLVALCVIDLKSYILPDQLVIICAVFGGIFFLVRSLYGDAPPLSFSFLMKGPLLSACIYGLIAYVLAKIMKRFLKKDALGFGDVKFFAVSGLFLGISYLSAFMILSGLLGVFMALVWMRMGKGSVFPFGPALIAALYVCLLDMGGFGPLQPYELLTLLL